MSTILFVVPIAPAATERSISDYQTVKGVLYSDYFGAYPFEKHSLDIGFSKWGELISTDTLGLAGQGVGLQYPGSDEVATYDQTADTSVDPFANEYVSEDFWVEGWVLNITYVESDTYHNYWAFALYSEMLTGSAGKDYWIHVDSALDTSVKGGRKSNAYPVTDPITVLYDGPRLFVGKVKTVIYMDSGHEDALVSLVFTIIFNKVKKSVLILKDIKSLVETKLGLAMQVEFSERGQWDLGTGTPPYSYAHVHEGLTTAYDGFYQYWYKGAPKEPGDGIKQEGTYDKIQIISDELANVGFVAHWPKPITTYVEATQHMDRTDIILTMSTKVERIVVPKDWEGTTAYELKQDPVPYPRTIGSYTTPATWSENPWVFVNNRLMDEGAGKDYTYNDETDTITWVGTKPVEGNVVLIVYKEDKDQEDMTTEPLTPFTIAEWCWDFTQFEQQFRAASLYGVMDRHDGDDDNRVGTTGDVLDSEVKYQEEEIFNPFDLRDAVDKTTKRCVNYWVSDGVDDYDFAMSPSFSDVGDTHWDEYCYPAEWVFVDDVFQVREGAQSWVTGDYDIIAITDDPIPTLTEEFEGPIAKCTKIKLAKEFIQKGDGHHLSVATAADPTWDEYDPGTGLGDFYMDHERGVITLKKAVASDDTLEVTYDVAVVRFKWNPKHSAAGWVRGTGDDTAYAIPPDGAVIKILYPVTWDGDDGTGDIWGGRYEWTIVGRDARTVDVAGAAMVTAALKNKYLELGMGGMDMAAPTDPAVPNVMALLDTDYRDDIGRGTLYNSWCLTWPITSSNMIGVGGPLKNELTRYFNEHTQAFGAYPPHADASIENKIFASTCWARNAYQDVYEGGVVVTGYAVIAVYKDLDGTVGLLIWGETGQDTFFACKFFHEEAAHQLNDARRGVTAWIIEIDYTQHEPYITVLECLGTISEAADHQECKGDIHDC